MNPLPHTPKILPRWSDSGDLESFQWSDSGDLESDTDKTEHKYSC